MRANVVNIRKNYEEGLTRTIEKIKEGGAALVPTDTVYGLVANFYDSKAKEKIYRLKKRPLNKPLTAICSSISTIEAMCEDIPSAFYVLAETYLPGPITVVLKKSQTVKKITNDGFDSLAFRIPDTNFLYDLTVILNSPLASTSANISGEKFIYDFEEANEILKNKADIAINDGKTKYKTESTIISLLYPNPQILREGAISKKEIETVLQTSLL